uniref:SCP domain-containing protein n=1 Tax=Macrostomum lignano TaxID=282301 RepID=A0A1I8FRM3_9PLAT
RRRMAHLANVDSNSAGPTSAAWPLAAPQHRRALCDASAQLPCSFTIDWPAAATRPAGAARAAACCQQTPGATEGRQSGGCGCKWRRRLRTAWLQLLSCRRCRPHAEIPEIVGASYSLLIGLRTNSAPIVRLTKRVQRGVPWRRTTNARELHGCPPLELSEKLARSAQGLGNHLASHWPAAAQHAPTRDAAFHFSQVVWKKHQGGRLREGDRHQTAKMFYSRAVLSPEKLSMNKWRANIPAPLSR